MLTLFRRWRTKRAVREYGRVLMMLRKAEDAGDYSNDTFSVLATGAHGVAIGSQTNGVVGSVDQRGGVTAQTIVLRPARGSELN